MHVEQSMEDVHGDIIRSSGWPEVAKISNLSIITGTDAVIKLNHLKRVRYCIQVTVCTMYNKNKEAYLKSESRLLRAHLFDCKELKITVSDVFPTFIIAVSSSRKRVSNFQEYLWNRSTNKTIHTSRELLRQLV